jgi:preprotein translocase subunit SecE
MDTTRALSWPQQTKSYIDEVKAEMRRVTWPNRKEVLATTWVVIAVTFLLSAYFFVVDNIVNSIVTKIINHFTQH